MLSNGYLTVETLKYSVLSCFSYFVKVIRWQGLSIVSFWVLHLNNPRSLSSMNRWLYVVEPIKNASGEY